MPLYAWPTVRRGPPNDKTRFQYPLPDDWKRAVVGTRHRA